MSNFIDSNDVLQGYLKQIQKFEPLTFEKEQELAFRWKNEQDESAAHELMESYLRLVVKVAISFKGYGLPITEVIQEGNIGLIQAISRFEPERGFRLSTYAMWWIRAQIQEYILANWSMVKIGTTSSQKKLFFNLKRLRNKLRESGSDEMSMDVAEKIAKELGVKINDVIGMEQRLQGGDQSLNATISGDEGTSEWMDLLVEDGPSQEDLMVKSQEDGLRRKALKEAISILDEREKAIFTSRQLCDERKVPTLEALSQHFGISRERVRQLEKRAFEKICKHIQTQAA